MKLRLVMFLLAVLSAAPVSAQTFALQPVQMVEWLRGWELVGPITLTPETPGDELLYRLPVLRGIVIVVVPHAPVSGPLGIVPAPGVCIERFTTLDAQVLDGALTIADVNGDGIDDVLATSANGVQVLAGIGLASCR